MNEVTCPNCSFTFLMGRVQGRVDRKIVCACCGEMADEFYENIETAQTVCQQCLGIVGWEKWRKVKQ